MLMAIVGGLGFGKTLSLTYFGFNDYMNDTPIFSNYKLNFKHTFVNSYEDINYMTKGTFLGDELWYWIDSRESMKNKNKAVSQIILVSRKRDCDVLYTTQDFMQMDKRVRNITDFIAYPQLNKAKTKCRVSILHRLSNKIIKRFNFPTEFIFELYDTKEEIGELKKNGDN